MRTATVRRRIERSTCRSRISDPLRTARATRRPHHVRHRLPSANEIISSGLGEPPHVQNFPVRLIQPRTFPHRFQRNVRFLAPHRSTKLPPWNLKVVKSSVLSRLAVQLDHDIELGRRPWRAPSPSARDLRSAPCDIPPRHTATGTNFLTRSQRSPHFQSRRAQLLGPVLDRFADDGFFVRGSFDGSRATPNCPRIRGWIAPPSAGAQKRKRTPPRML